MKQFKDIKDSNIILSEDFLEIYGYLCIVGIYRVLNEYVDIQECLKSKAIGDVINITDTR